jgi:cyclic pyranopterin phosphate synthase
MNLSHVDSAGQAKMVDVSAKQVQRRQAIASGRIYLGSETLALIRGNQMKKGDVLAVARVAAINAAKQTWALIPLCHNITLDDIEVDLRLIDNGVAILARVGCDGKTGAEMEALTAVAVAALTIYDMCKAVDRKMVIGEIRLQGKRKHAVPG